MKTMIVAVLAIGLGVAGCGESRPATSAVPPDPSAEIASVVADGTGTDQAVGCMAYLSLRQVAIEAQTPPGDVTAVRAALGAWEAFALKTMSPDEVNQYYASSVAVEDDARPEVVTVTSDWCLANQPAA